jgi:DNA-binding NarL/FixJ family response regulator
MPSEREKALSRDAAARARLADDPVHLIKQRRNPRQAPLERRGIRGEAAHRYDVPFGDAWILSPREIEVLRLVADGLMNREIGVMLFKSSETIKSHVTNILRHLEARDRAHAVAIALRAGIID